MKVESTVKPDKIQRLGGKCLVNFDIVESERDGMPYFTYEQVALQIDATESDVSRTIEKENKKLNEQRKQSALAAIKVRTTTGKLFYGDEKSRVDISDAISLSAEYNVTTTIWKLAEEFDGSKLVVVTIDELKEARRLALEEKAKIIGIIGGSYE
jgi:hypothetical protein